MANDAKGKEDSEASMVSAGSALQLEDSIFSLRCSVADFAGHVLTHFSGLGLSSEATDNLIEWSKLDISCTESFEAGLEAQRQRVLSGLERALETGDENESRRCLQYFSEYFNIESRKPEIKLSGWYDISCLWTEIEKRLGFDLAQFNPEQVEQNYMFTLEILDCAVVFFREAANYAAMSIEEEWAAVTQKNAERTRKNFLEVLLDKLVSGNKFLEVLEVTEKIAGDHQDDQLNPPYFDSAYYAFIAHKELKEFSLARSDLERHMQVLEGRDSRDVFAVIDLLEENISRTKDGGDVKTLRTQLAFRRIIWSFLLKNKAHILTARIPVNFLGVSIQAFSEILGDEYNKQFSVRPIKEKSSGVTVSRVIDEQYKMKMDAYRQQVCGNIYALAVTCYNNRDMNSVRDLQQYLPDVEGFSDDYSMSFKSILVLAGADFQDDKVKKKTIDAIVNRWSPKYEWSKSCRDQVVRQIKKEHLLETIVGAPRTLQRKLVYALAGSTALLAMVFMYKSDMVQCALLRNEGIVYDTSDDNKNGLIADERINSSLLGGCIGKGCLNPREAVQKLRVYAKCRCDDLQSVEPALNRLKALNMQETVNEIIVPILGCNPEARKYVTPSTR